MHTRIPPQVQAIMAKKLERSAPGYMKKYVGAYMQQNLLHPQVGGPMPTSGAAVMPHAPHANGSWREQHFQPTNSPPPPAQPTATPGSQVVPSQPGQPQPGANDPYMFITDPTAIQPRQFSLPGSGSRLTQVVYGLGALVLLIIIISIAKSVLSGPPKLAPFVPVAQDQQQMIHLLVATQKQPNLSDSANNFIATAQLSLTSNQADLFRYLSKNNYKVSDKQLALSLNPNLDQQLTTAAANANYEQTLNSIMAAQLNRYLSDLKHAYTTTSGKNGRTLLNSDYDQAKLLLTQLQSN